MHLSNKLVVNCILIAKDLLLSRPQPIKQFNHKYFILNIYKLTSLNCTACVFILLEYNRWPIFSLYCFHCCSSVSNLSLRAFILNVATLEEMSLNTKTTYKHSSSVVKSTSTLLTTLIL